MGDCSICLKKIQDGTAPFTCEHSFHKVCIQTWRNRKNNCPNCRCADIYIATICKTHDGKPYVFTKGKLTYNMPLTLQHYKWNFKGCKQSDSHNVQVSRAPWWVTPSTAPFGVVGVCSCGEVQDFNYVG